MTAWKQDAGKPRIDLVPPELVQGAADVLTFGADKYGPRNWERGMDWGRVFGALQRHLWAFWGGEDRDPETGLPHTHHAACCIAFLMAYEARGLGNDDRARNLAKTNTPNENLPVAAHIAKRDAERSMLETEWRKWTGQDTEPQPLEWPAEPASAPPDGLGDVSATHAAESAKGTPAARVCGGCRFAEEVGQARIVNCGWRNGWKWKRSTCEDWQPLSDLASLAARDAPAWQAQDNGVE